MGLNLYLNFLARLLFIYLLINPDLVDLLVCFGLYSAQLKLN